MNRIKIYRYKKYRCFSEMKVPYIVSFLRFCLQLSKTRNALGQHSAQSGLKTGRLHHKDLSKGLSGQKQQMGAHLFQDMLTHRVTTPGQSEASGCCSTPQTAPISATPPCARGIQTQKGKPNCASRATGGLPFQNHLCRSHRAVR